MDKKGSKFKLKKGARQGDLFSPNLFNGVLEEIFWELGWEAKGIKIDGECLNNLRFADNTVLLSQNKEELQEMAKEFKNKSKKTGLVINWRKTMLLSISKK